jgi:penicillin-binding protein 1C
MNELVLMHHTKLKANQIMNAAAMVVEVETGNILSYVGNVYQPKDASLESHVDVLTSPRSPGSSLKPLLYASLLTEGSMLPTQLIPDIPTQIGGYTPQNFDLGYDGAVPAHTALARSLNIPAVKMLQLYNYRKFYDVLKNCGITTLTRPADDYGMSLILGGCEIKPLELAGVYSSMARSYLHQRSDANQWSMPKYFKTQQTEIKTGSWKFNTAALWHTFNAMNEVMRPGEEGLWNLFGASQKIAWKTGTSFGFRDGWAVGITPKYCVIVWIGNTDGEGRAELTGINTAAPLLFDIFRILPNSTWFTPPTEQFTYTEICKQSGYRAGADCPDQKLMMIPDAGKSSALCPYHRIIHLDASGMYQVNSTCVSPSEMINRSWFILPATIEYYYKQRHADYKQPPPYKADCNNENERSFDIIYPENNTKIYVPKEISGESGRTVFTAAATSSKAKLFWHLDDKFIAETQNFHQIAVGPKQGEHVLTVVDENGIRISRRFVIVDKSSK